VSAGRRAVSRMRNTASGGACSLAGMSARRIAIFLAVIAAGCSFESPPDSIPPPNADPQTGCAIECHGDDTSNAPPRSMSGAVETTSVAVGAHREHMSVAPDWHRQVECSDCHVVPAEVDSPGHIDGDGKAEVKFAMIAGPGATWNGTTCTTQCHGSALTGGMQTVPTWTKVDNTQNTCGSCHGRPPQAPHPNNTSCATCHSTLDVDGVTFLDPKRHIDGIVDVVAPSETGGCATCHGSATSSAPPKDLHGNMDHTAPGVGAHAAHLKPSTWHLAVPCASCHVVPTTFTAPGHIDPDNVAEVIFGPLNPGARYTAGTTQCSNLYCHGTGQSGNGTMSWVASGPLACNACHRTDGTGMSGRHEKHVKDAKLPCAMCHLSVVNLGLGIIRANLHINGKHEVLMPKGSFNATTRTCTGTGCHGVRAWNDG
jgi:predicted CxxxxCH...CXXCH cytochrome family protein